MRFSGGRRSFGSGGGGRRFGGRPSFGNRDFGDSDAPKPVKVGDEYDVEISEVGSKGDGIARVNNFVVFVNGAKQGEKTRIKITDVRNRFAIGEKVSGSGEEAGEATEATEETEGAGETEEPSTEPEVPEPSAESESEEEL